ncbi:hypothetical protein GOV13_02510 [Candidatus Pacearchaeota archaeon]|nr:hypothetical protein [Candidatus Pacearchaeota archaeon]
MVEAGDFKINEIYQGGPSSLNPPSANPITAGSLGLTTDPRSANLLKEVSGKLSSGVKQIELEFVSPEVFDSIPKQQLQEVRRLSKLTGVGLSVHGPVIDTTGVSQQGFSELNREASEKRIIQTVERSHELDPTGNIIVNFHSAESLPGTEWEKIPDMKKGFRGEAKKLIVVNKESGKLAPLESERKFYPIMQDDETRRIIPSHKGKIYSPEKELKVLNDSEWINSITSIETFKKQADEVKAGAMATLTPLFTEEHIEGITPAQQGALQQIQRSETFLSNVESSFNSIYNKAYKFGDEETKKHLDKISNYWVEENEKMMKELREKLKKNPTPFTQAKINAEMIERKSQMFDKVIHGIPNKDSNKEIRGIKDIKAPEMYIPVEQFATEQSSKTFGNAAFEAYDKFKDNAPIISIENPPAGFALSTGEDLKNLAEKSREHFVERLVKEENKSKREAEKIAEKLIGVTWDVGHINMIRKQGFDDEDIIKETEKIAPFIKHVHLSDNFGFEHTELPMGMGNVPMKEIMDKLGKKGFEANKIIEAAGWWQHFQTAPVQETMENFGSPMYSAGGAPGLYWNQTIGLQQGYSGGYGMMLPQTHYQTFGAGFSQLPTELGGQVQGAGGSRMSGRPME